MLKFILFILLIEFSSSSAEWEMGSGFRRKALSIPSPSKAGFTLLDSSATGVIWTNSVPAKQYVDREYLTNGSGLALGDYDNDGLCDLFLCNKFGPCALYRNLGNWRFEEVAMQAGVSCTNQISNGAVFADVNGDGFLDLLVSSFTGPNALFINNRNGTFTNTTQAAELISRGGSTSQALADLDGDGFLDLYVAYYGIEAILRDIGKFSTKLENGKPVVMGRYAKRLRILDGVVLEVGEPDFIYRNSGGQFQSVPWEKIFLDEAGKPMAAQPDFGLAVQIRDINGDGLPDIYVCNDFQTPDRCWINDGAGHFRPIDALALRGMSYASMGVDFGDLDRDGNLDFFTLEMLSRDHSPHLSHASPMEGTKRVQNVTGTRVEVGRNMLAWNRGDNTYADIAWYSGLAASDWSWTPIFLDVDLDGYEDVLICNGHVHDVNDRDLKLDPAESARLPRESLKRRMVLFPPIASPKVAFRNRGDLTFEDVSDAWNFNSKKIAHGMAVADLDNDGDLDVVMNSINNSPIIYRNNGSAPRISVRLKGKAPNTFGVGAKIALHGAHLTQTQEMVCGGRYLSSDDFIRVFAANELGENPFLEVIWRSGVRNKVTGIQANYLYEIDEEGASSRVEPIVTVPKVPAPLFEDVSSRINHVHSESSYDDFSRQNLLPKSLTQLGPGISWFDFNGDGAEDLVIGAGKGGRITFFQNDGLGNFTSTNLVQERPLADDSTTLLAGKERGKTWLLTGLALGERTVTNAAMVSQTFLATNTSPIFFNTSSSSCGPLALGDVDGDGDLDLFVGGRFIPGQYPRAASSAFYFNEEGEFKLGEKATGGLTSVGLVSAAVFSDLDGDGFPELILACEWGPIRIFKIKDKTLREITSEWGLGGQLGIWSSVTTGDFDGDGRMDIVAGNWGLNSFYNRGGEGPWYLYYGDFSGEGNVSIFEAYSNRVMGAVVPFRPLTELAVGNQWLHSRFRSNTAFSKASIPQIFGGGIRFDELRVTTLASTIFWNRRDHFDPQPLPPQAQWAPAFGLNVADFDGDGLEDLFIAQNFFGVRPGDERLDAGRGLLLRGSSAGLVPVPGQESGLKIYHEQRGSAIADFDGDGRVDLCVTQNASQTRLFKNIGAKPGVRVRLAGPSSNPYGFSTIVRIVQDGKAGPAREIHCGSGYWSQDSAVQVFSVHGENAEIIARWPGGKEVRALIPANGHEVVLDTEGSLKVLR
jgi:hypothetical protein